MSFCGYHPTNTLLRESIPEKIDGKPLCGSKPLKKRPVDETSLHTERRQGRVLPEPKLITVMKRTHPSILGNCCPTDIERQGLARKINHTSTHQKDVKREALFKLLLQRQLLREGSKAKKHFDHHYGGPTKNASLLHQLQEELHHQARRSTSSPLQRNPNLVRDLLRACTSSSLSSSMVLSNERPRHNHISSPSRHNTFIPTRPSKNGRVVYDYAHAA